MRVSNTITSLLVCCVAACAADVSVPIRDKSPSGSPVSSTGNVIISVTPLGTSTSIISHRDEWKARNVSDKSIVALVATLSIVLSSDDKLSRIAQYEAFFHPVLANPGDEIDLVADSRGGEAMKIKDIEPFQSYCDVVLRWVQFADGTTFGDDKYAANLLQARQETWSALAHLNEVYRTKGAAEFLRSLQEPVPSSANADGYIEHLRLFQKQHGTEAAFERLQVHLRMAEQRASLSRLSTTQP